MRALRALHRKVWGKAVYDATYGVAPSSSNAHRSRALGFGAISFGMLFVLFGIAPSAANATKPDPEHKVTLCHATDSYSNPYVEITVDVASVLHNGHDGHDGPVFYPAIPKHTKWGDIIPPFDFGPGEVYGGKNWTPDGIAILNNGCNAPSIPTTTTTSSVPETTTVAPTTTTSLVGGTTTSTSSPPPPPPGESTTTTSTSVPETPSSSTTTTTISTVTTAGVTTTVPGATTTSISGSEATLASSTTVASAHHDSLPFTGGNSFAAVVAGLVLIAAGFGLTRRSPLRP
jgi:hypothetical protein